MLLKRIWTYSKEQLEPGSRLFLSVVVTLFIYLLIKLDHSLKTFSFRFLVPALGTFSLLIYYRISDEFKDKATDEKFFPDRPLPSGRVKFNDLKILLIAVSVSGWILNILYPFALKEFLVAFVFTYAMGKWFFMEKTISSNRMLAFITHAPVGIVLYWYAEAWILNDLRLDWSVPEKMSVIAFIVLPGLTWEILRKTYLPKDEMPGYQIYSTMLGFRGSLLFASLWVMLTLINNFILISMFGFLEVMTWPLLAINISLLAIITAHAFRPLMKNLKPIAELYMGLHLLLPLAVLLYEAYV